MSLTVSAQTSEAGHWYTRDGTPRYTITGSNGKERNTTLRDARKENLVPSVTTVLNVAAKPGLIVWMQRQVLLAALTLPRRDDEPEEAYLERIIGDSKEQGKAAADAGTEIHAAIQGFYEAQPIGKHLEHIEGCKNALDGHFGALPWVCEKAFAHELGFGGKVDLHASGAVVDIKTKEFTDPSKVDGYDEHLMQLAAYRVGLRMPEARCANVFVSRSVPGLAVVKEWSAEDLQRGWTMFGHLLNFWQIKNGHK